MVLGPECKIHKEFICVKRVDGNGDPKRLETADKNLDK